MNSRSLGLAALGLLIVIGCGSGDDGPSHPVGAGGNGGAGGMSGSGGIGHAGQAGSGGGGGAAHGSGGAAGGAGIAGAGGQAAAAGAGGAPTDSFSAAPHESITGTLGKPVSRIAIVPPGDPVEVFRPSRAGLDGDRANAHLYRVTSLDESSTTQGTLAHAIKAGTPNHNPGDASHGRVDGQRIVVFDVGGRMPMTAKMQFTRAFTWIAGQTAPSLVILDGFTLEIRASNVVVQHLFDRRRKPANTDESNTARNFAVVAPPTGADVEDIWVDHCAGIGASDEAMMAWSNGFQNGVRVRNALVSSSWFGLMQYTLNDPSAPYHESKHNYPFNVTPGTSMAAIEVGLFGGHARTPQIAIGSSRALFNVFTSDYRGYSGASGDAAPLTLNENPNSQRPWIFANLPVEDQGSSWSAVGSYVEAGYHGWTGINSPKRVSGRFSKPPDSTPHRYWEEGNRHEALGTGEMVEALGSDGVMSIADSAGSRVRWTTPVTWSEIAPTHASIIRQRVLNRSGPRASQRMQLVTNYFELVDGQAAKPWSERDDLALSEEAPMLPAVDEIHDVWTEPADPFGLHPDGLTHIEHALHDLTAALGGTRFGNVDRTVHVPGGGALRVDPDGTVAWTGAPATHDSINVEVVYQDGTTGSFTVKTD